MKGFRKSLGLYTIEKLEDTTNDISKEPVEDTAEAPTDESILVEKNTDKAILIEGEDTAEFVEDIADVLEEEPEVVEEPEPEPEVVEEPEPVVATQTKPLEEPEESKLTMSNIMLGVGVAIVLGVLAFVIFRYVVPKPSTRYGSKYENSLVDVVDAVDAVDAINEFDVSVTNTSDFSFDTAYVDAISPIEMIN